MDDLRLLQYLFHRVNFLQIQCPFGHVNVNARKLLRHCLLGQSDYL